ncbi:insulinase family protein [Clostridium sp. 19966]|uniref:insulinase family protein n=1 Tax=Clostridium sp. 19966 TaxID=2768166 RepID=UPI0028DEE896|nr:insulinase family protein [Clostridium sp. 19966]MDT8718408.1 insulinase family protein [Clostridium sp. 19966]
MNEFEKDNIYSGFKFINEEELKEINSKAFTFEHVKSGAKLLYLQNEDDNKVFSIGFRTPPKDSTGVFHILEHSVLCGSEKYPVKEPFVELLKGSLNTFLNAFTFSDKTMYPVASKNHKDFANLIDVYMDAVFKPNIYKHREILEQEGWHHEINSPGEDISYKGVVYNEMKGAFSSPEGILMRKIQNSLFPDTPYGFESGGDPEYIPDLTYENFIENHRKYYSPANSYIYLYGNMDLKEKLQYLDREYLSKYEKIEVDSHIEAQKPIGNVEIVEEYPILPNEEEADKTYLSLNFAASKATDAEEYLSLEILEYILLESSAAPLKKALLDSGICKDAFGMYDNSILQTYFSVIAKNSNEDKKEEFKKVVFDTLKSLADKGIDKKLIEAAINVAEFKLREADYQSMPKGLVYSIKSMDSWLYDDVPTKHLKFEESLKNIKKALTEDYFEKLIEKYFLNSDHQSLVIVKPSKTAADEANSKLKEKLDSFKKSLSSDEIDILIKRTKSLKERQSTEDSQQDLRKIPMLSLEDIDKKAERLPLAEKKIQDVKVLHHDIPTNKIAYLNLYFSTAQVEADKIQYLSLLENVLGRIDTKKYNYEDLSNEINIKTGDIGFENNVFSDKKTDEKYYPKFAVKTKVLLDKVGDSFELIDQILYHSVFENKKRIKEIIQEIKSRQEMSINQRGNLVAARRLLSYFSPAGKYSEHLRGVELYHFICDLDKNFEAKFEEIKASLKAVAGKIFIKEALVISITGDQEIYAAVNSNIGKIKFAQGEFKEELPKLQLNEKNEGLTTSSKVQYVAAGFNYRKLGYEYCGKVQVLKNIISLNYLWNNVRVMGGAYGCGASFLQNGNVYFSSYRDPNLSETLKVYEDTYNFLEGFEADEYEMTKYIIGTIASLDYPLTPKSKGEYSDGNYFSSVTYEETQKEREEVIETTKEDIKAFSQLLKEVMEKGYICVLGNAEKIQQSKDKFNSIVDVFK